jgi:hypothetical protein
MLRCLLKSRFQVASRRVSIVEEPAECASKTLSHVGLASVVRQAMDQVCF